MSAQDNVLTAGFQFKPIFSSKFFNTGPQSKDSSGVNFILTPNSGYCAGMIIRYGITNKVSFESGINYVKRTNEITIKDGGFKGVSKFSIIGYEIPVSGLVFIQLGEKVFMDASLGASFDFFPSDVESEDYYFKHFGRRQYWVFASVLANLGWEYRTEKSGYFYLGASYHRPFKDIYSSTIGYYVNDDYVTGQQFLISGNYLTFDIRYFFHEDPLKKKAKKKKVIDEE
ncbi:MAG: hypothetical protein ACHQNT_09540 [Bacteroidia bacterium]